MIRTWKLARNQLEEIHFLDESSLDAITRQLPDGYYSTFRTYDGCTRVIGLTTHLRRLPGADASALRRSLVKLLEPYRPGEARLRVMQTKRKQVYVSIEPLKPLPPEVYQKGVRVETTGIERHDPRAKSTTFISASDKERKHIAEAGLFEALLVKNGKILEGMTSNFFYILRPERTLKWSKRHSKGVSTTGLTSTTPSAQRGMLYTAQNDILLGVTRAMVIRAARGRGVEVRYRALELSQLPAVHEAFITSSSRGIVPVVQIDDRKVGRGRIGSLTKMLMQAYDEYVLQKAEKI